MRRGLRGGANLPGGVFSRPSTPCQRQATDNPPLPFSAPPGKSPWVNSGSVGLAARHRKKGLPQSLIRRRNLKKVGDGNGLTSGRGIPGRQQNPRLLAVGVVLNHRLSALARIDHAQPNQRRTDCHSRLVKPTPGSQRLIGPPRRRESAENCKARDNQLPPPLRKMGLQV